MATSIATGALKPKVAVALSASLNLVGAFLSIEVAKTVGSGIVDLDNAQGEQLMLIVFAAIVVAVATWLIYRISRRVPERIENRGFRSGQIGSASLAHGTNDAQETMSVIFLALIAHGSLTVDNDVPFWGKLTCALAIVAGTYLGGWRVIRTLGKGLVEIASPQGMAAETSSAAIILTSSHLGLPLSTTYVATGSILGTGIGKRGAQVRWGVAGRMVVAWVITLPASANNVNDEWEPEAVSAATAA